MLEQISNAVTFYAHYVASKVGATGLTVTVDVWEVQKDGTATEIVTAGSATEIGDGLYRYILASGSVDAEGEYLAVFKTTDSSVDQQHLPAVWSIQRAGVENLDAAVSTRSTVTAAEVNVEVDTALADYDGPTKAELDAGLAGLNDLSAAEVATAVWVTAAVRTLTANVNGVTIVSAVSGNTITVYEFDTWAFTLTDSNLALTDYENLIFVVKKRASDADAESILFVDITTGLEYIGQAAASGAGLGSLTKDSGTSFSVLVAMSEVAAKVGDSFGGTYTWYLKGIDTDDDPDQGFVLAKGSFVITRSGARAII